MDKTKFVDSVSDEVFCFILAKALAPDYKFRMHEDAQTGNWWIDMKEDGEWEMVDIYESRDEAMDALLTLVMDTAKQEFGEVSIPHAPFDCDMSEISVLFVE